MRLFTVNLIDRRTGKVAYTADAVPLDNVNEVDVISIDEILNRESHYYWFNGGSSNRGDDGEFMGIIQTIDFLVEQHIITLALGTVINLHEQTDQTYIWDPSSKR